MAGTGGKREGAGRPSGRKNKITADVKEIAQGFGMEAMQGLIDIARDPKSPPAAKVAAIKEVLDRGYGKAKQHTELSGGVTYNVLTGVPNVTDSDD